MYVPPCNRLSVDADSADALLGKFEIQATLAVQLECDGAVDGTNRRLLLFAFLRYEVDDSLHIPIVASHPNVVLVSISTWLASWDRNPIEPFSIRLWTD
jgi:hypothetical protein